GTFRHSRPTANGLPRDNETSEMFEKGPELRVPGSVGDSAMQGKVLGDCILAALERAVDSIEALHDLANLGRGRPRRRKARGFDLDPGAQLHDVQHRAQGRQLVEVDA